MVTNNTNVVDEEATSNKEAFLDEDVNAAAAAQQQQQQRENNNIPYSAAGGGASDVTNEGNYGNDSHQHDDGGYYENNNPAYYDSGNYDTTNHQQQQQGYYDNSQQQQGYYDNDQQQQQGYYDSSQGNNNNNYYDDNNSSGYYDNNNNYYDNTGGGYNNNQGNYDNNSNYYGSGYDGSGYGEQGNRDTYSNAGGDNGGYENSGNYGGDNHRDGGYHHRQNYNGAYPDDGASNNYQDDDTQTRYTQASNPYGGGDDDHDDTRSRGTRSRGWHSDDPDHQSRSHGGGGDYYDNSSVRYNKGERTSYDDTPIYVENNEGDDAAEYDHHHHDGTSTTSGRDSRYNDDYYRDDDDDQHSRDGGGSSRRSRGGRSKGNNSRGAGNSRRSGGSSSRRSPRGRRQGANDGDDEETREGGGDNGGGRRPYKYSTGGLGGASNCKKYFCIALMFVIAMAIIMVISYYLNKLIFGDGTDNTGAGLDGPKERNPNETAFVRDKMYIDGACSRGQLEMDEGTRCNEECEPQFYHCCDTLHPNKVFDYTPTFLKLTNSTDPTKEKKTAGTASNNNNNGYYFEEDEEIDKLGNCSLATDPRGCYSYSKCQSLSKIIEPAPANLPVLCSKHQLEKDRVSCEELCQTVECCFSEDASCRGSNMDICMDYAPCQNLRPGFPDKHIPVAPNDLDWACLKGTADCVERCSAGLCCNSNAADNCLQRDFIPCVTYAACNNASYTNVTFPDLFAHLSPIPAEVVLACSPLQPGKNRTETPKSCPEYCEAANCCYDADPAENCFRKDPLGCIAWNQECQYHFHRRALQGEDLVRF